MTIVGVDEVGRGCWAGPLVAGAVVLSKPIKGLKDSKQLSRLQRENLASEVELSALSIGLGWVEPYEIDRLGLTESVRLAMVRAMSQIKIIYDSVIVDGNYNFLSDDSKSSTLIKADSSVPEVSAASIVAKVARDNYMYKAAINYPGYGFEKHVGYGTKLHQDALIKLGVCQIHRLSYKPIAKLI